jgi:hypothetical protein
VSTGINNVAYGAKSGGIRPNMNTIAGGDGPGKAIMNIATSTPNEARMKARTRFSFPLAQEVPLAPPQPPQISMGALAESTGLNESFDSSMITTNSQDLSQNQR